MSSVTTIKGIDEETWKTFKTEAAKHGATMGDFFGMLLQKHMADESLTQQEAFAAMDRLRAKSGKWSGSEEIRKWRHRRMS
ncbi:hypothetical protein HY641_04325 [Candidatus Woesearchaeota archaeon]|nr:hypothetical protein [Candidatus Woesearchaeota archaeon]